jgi:hypothetical protein
VNTPTCAWCDGPLPTAVRAHTNEPRVYCSRECDAARRNKRDYYAEEVEFLASTGAAPSAIVQQLDVKPATLVRSLERAGRLDLAMIVRPVVNRRKPCADCHAPVDHSSTRCRSCDVRRRMCGAA